MTASLANRFHFYRPAGFSRGLRVAATLGLASAMLTGCASGDGVIANPLHIKHHRLLKAPSELPPSNVTSIGVNSYLWRASLDVLSFMPLVETDSNGGVIVTDWYVNPANPGERMKLTISILDKDLRSDALRVAGARQVAQGGVWVDAPVQAATVQKLEDVILTKARDIRRASIEH